MELSLPQMGYSGSIREVTIGTGEKAITVGGQKVFNFHFFDGEPPKLPVVALEVRDTSIDTWPEACRQYYQDVSGDPAAWALKCVQEYKAKAIALQLASIDPMAENRSGQDAVKTVEAVMKAVNVPLFVFGCGQVQKDSEVLKLVAEVAAGKNIALGPVQDKNYKAIGAAAIAYQHVVIASSPIDVNLAKQLNILLLELGVPENKILMDPTTGGLGYGLEYTYSVMERDRLAALVQRDDKLGFPMICNLAEEVWKTKEAFLPEAVEPRLGKESVRGVIMEAVTATLLSLAGADILIMRHPQAAQLLTGLSTQLVGD
ncbi:MAG: acetyl-CoA decarbonylase/synthase complex subunit delta [Candidatus Omnitrophica bacterium]|nr:acetyl-CoA decarbonylase/synthase complex subunit delta [Candidatus Omnitrophota bacterium]